MGAMADTGAAGPTRRYDGGNVLIDTLPAAERALVASRLEVFETDVPSCMLVRDAPIEDVFFPIDAVFSTTADLRLGNAYEVAATGRQGVIGAELVVGVETAPRSVMVQIDGRAARMPRSAFLACIDESRALSSAVQRYLVRRLYTAEQFVACNFAHDTTQRCARWFLMLLDEVGRDAFVLRAEFFGMMLGLPPPAAIAAAGPLNRLRVVQYENEELRVLDRNKLLPLACECYEEQRRFVPQRA
jgi:CRP-like cAMP-binding protein